MIRNIYFFELNEKYFNSFLIYHQILIEIIEITLSNQAKTFFPIEHFDSLRNQAIHNQ